MHLILIQLNHWYARLEDTKPNPLFLLPSYRRVSAPRNVTLHGWGEAELLNLSCRWAASPQLASLRWLAGFGAEYDSSETWPHIDFGLNIREKVN